jgi:hypothetical protein
LTLSLLLSMGFFAPSPSPSSNGFSVSILAMAGTGRCADVLAAASLFSFASLSRPSRDPLGLDC